jgi:hypothetical protein
MSELARRDVLDLLRRLEEGGALGPCHLSLAARLDLGIEQFQAIARFLGRVHDGSKWWTADLLLEAEVRFGESAYQIAAATGRSERTLANWIWAASKVPRSMRREGLSFTHHVLVAPLDPSAQREWLDRAEREQWSSRELQAALRDGSHGAVRDCDVKFQRGVERLRDLARDCYAEDVTLEVRVLAPGIEIVERAA